MDFPHVMMPHFNVITPWSIESMGMTLLGNGFQTMETAATAAQVANLIHYYPFRVWEPFTVRKITYIVGGTANGNVDAGVYTWEKNRLINSGSTAQGAINTLQELDVTDTLLMPGRYFMAIQFSSGTGTAFRISHGDENLQAIMPKWEEAAGSFGLPTAAAIAQSTQGSANIVAMALHQDATV